MSRTAGISRVRVFIASSLDGFIAGPNDELDWLPGPESGAEDRYTPFFAEVGAMLMGRGTYDVVSGMPMPWPYGETPVLVATRRPLKDAPPSVKAVQGPIASLVAEAKERAGARDVYLDGGALIRSALDEGLVDELIITVVPVVLGAGHPLFAGTTRRHLLELGSSQPIGGGMVELRYTPKR